MKESKSTSWFTVNNYIYAIINKFPLHDGASERDLHSKKTLSGLGDFFSVKTFCISFSWLSNLCLLNEVQYFWICLVSFWRVVRSNIAHEQWCTATLQGSNQPVYKQHRAHLASVETELNHHSDFYVHMVCRIYTEMCCQLPR